MQTRTALGLAKLYVCAATFLAGYFVLVSLGFHGGSLLLFAVLTLLFGMGMLDAVVNDLLPDDYKAPAVIHTKYLAFIALSGINVSMLYPELLALNYGLKSVLYGFNAAVAAGVAVLDLHERHRQVNEQRKPDRLPFAQDS